MLTICTVKVGASAHRSLLSKVGSRSKNCLIAKSLNGAEKELLADVCSLLGGSSRHRSPALELLQLAEADVKYLRWNSNTQGHFPQIEPSAFPLGKKERGRENPALTPGNHFGNERQKRLKCCDGGKEKKFTLGRWGLLMSLTPPRINTLISLYT